MPTGGAACSRRRATREPTCCRTGRNRRGCFTKRELPARNGQPIGMAWWSTANDGLLPLRFQVALRFETNEERVKRTGLDACYRSQLIAVAPLAARIEQLRKQGTSMAG